MTFVDRIQIALMLRRADNVIRNAKDRIAERARLNRPHVQSDHLIGWPVPRPPVERRAPDHSVGILYGTIAASLAALVVYVNAFHTEPTLLACSAPTQIASK
ncbi:hypothetical protein [Noviherbaspirillum malthae]|uniref:hypothetical protein n=1 Tax=Noviherbaspirillum malthae TaxID=1260987 RepID=UPI00188EED78|nr:hypothetical protein [Noviherbaspirillum malthae]